MEQALPSVTTSDISCSQCRMKAGRREGKGDNESSKDGIADVSIMCEIATLTDWSAYHVA